MPIRPITLSLFLFSFFLAAGQPLPRTNVYLFQVVQEGNGIKLQKPQFLTRFNAAGYNNHPVFFSDSELYLSVQMPSELQPDLYLLDLNQHTKTRVTNTPAGEYSPARMLDFHSFSTVRQEISGRDTLLRLWQFPVDRLSEGKPVFKYLDGIGYYEWLTNYEVAVFMVADPSYLGIADIRTDQVRPIATNVGRCFKRLRNGQIAYVQKSPYGEWLLMQINPSTREQPQKIIGTLPGSEDFAVMDDGTFLMGQGSKLYKFHPNLDESWVEMADLRFYNIRNISRLSITGYGSSQKMAIVAN